MTKFTDAKAVTQNQIVLPPAGRHQPAADFEEEKTPLTQRLGDFSDSVFEFIFNPNTIKFGILMFGGFCAVINLAGYHELLRRIFSVSLNEFGQELPIDAPLSDRLMSTVVQLPLVGNLLMWLDGITGGLFILFGMFTIWFFIQGLEIAGRFHLYFPGAAENLLFKQNRKRYEQPTNNLPITKKAYKLATNETLAILRWLSIAGIFAYLIDVFGMHQVRPWIDQIGNPLWLNCIWNTLAVAGVELAMILHLGYKSVSLSKKEKTEKAKLHL